MEKNLEKAALRNRIKAARPHSSQGLTENMTIVAREFFTPGRMPTIASYSSQETEPRTHDFNDLIVKEGATLVLPRIRGTELDFAEGPLVEGSFGILEPSGKAVDPDSIDLLFLPALAVDLAGNRLGKGKGFYDRFLSNNHSASFAVIFEPELLDSIPTEEFDEKISGVITPKAIHRF